MLILHELMQAQQISPFYSQITSTASTVAWTTVSLSCEVQAEKRNGKARFMTAFTDVLCDLLDMREVTYLRKKHYIYKKFILTVGENVLERTLNLSSPFCRPNKIQISIFLTLITTFKLIRKFNTEGNAPVVEYYTQIQY